MAKKPSSKADTPPDQDTPPKVEATKPLSDDTAAKTASEDPKPASDVSSADKATTGGAAKGEKATTTGASSSAKPEPKSTPAKSTPAKSTSTTSTAKTSSSNKAQTTAGTSAKASSTEDEKPQAKAASETGAKPAQKDKPAVKDTPDTASKTTKSTAKADKTTPADTSASSKKASSSDTAATRPSDAKPEIEAFAKSRENGGPAAATAPVVTEEPASQAAFLPLVLGGIAAGAIGFAAAYFGLAGQDAPNNDALIEDVGTLTALVETQSGTLESLSTTVDGLGSVDTSAIDAQTEAIGTLSDRLATLEEQLGSFDARLREVELRPVSESANEAAIAAYEQELDAAREEIATQRAELQALIDEALSTENAADRAARSAMQRAATSRIVAALDTGAPFATAIGDLQSTGVEVPETLSSVADSGVPSLSSLQESFPDAARAALTASRAVTGDGAGLTGFLRNQLGARSLEPREGNDPDAVLSRVEAALRDSRLRDALAEVEALPEEGRAELSDWAGQVALRLEAVSAAQSLSETVN